MKLILYLYAAFFLGLACVKAQNLVPNPGFEDHTECPDFLGSVRSYNFNSPWGILPNWQANPPDCTPDYYHPCGKRKFRAPKNLCGEMQPQEGVAYVGMILRIGAVDYGDPKDLMYREHITAKLSQTLKPDFQYLVRFYVALSDYSNYALAHIGALFTEEPLVIQENQAYTPQICSKGVMLKAPKTWMIIQDTLRAKGGEKFITLGNFEDYAQRKIRKITQNTQHFKKFNYNRAYYYLDDVFVEELGPFQQTLIEPKDSILLTDWGLVKSGEKVILDNIFFEFDKAELLPESFPELNKLVTLLKNDPGIHLTLIGHTDSIGTQEKNQLLSENRAKSVVRYLKSKGIQNNRLVYKGFGETQPIAGNGNPDGRQLNRRVEFMIHRPEQK
ncbi:MAG: OmpA family protein [Microscillaceae bacterium]|nr:OmpA family protein [Microscillaceae bacterium]